MRRSSASPNTFIISPHISPSGRTSLEGIALLADGRSILITANVRQIALPRRTTCSPYEANWLGTQRQEQPALVARKLLEAISGKRITRIGIDMSPVTAAAAIASDWVCVSIDAEIWQLRRRKDADELKLMKVGIECCGAMYEHARKVIEPGYPRTATVL